MTQVCRDNYATIGVLRGVEMLFFFFKTIKGWNPLAFVTVDYYSYYYHKLFPCAFSDVISGCTNRWRQLARDAFCALDDMCVVPLDVSGSNDAKQCSTFTGHAEYLE